jgi:hypothetical protein|tara:strand:- start:1759 stop:1989 length:231 start_codon:yes stop_codon:yes gene_type:complete
MKLEFNFDMGPEYMGADEIAVHAILNGYHLPKINKEQIIDKLIGDAYAGKLGPLDEDEVDFAIKIVSDIVKTTKKG